MRESRKSLVEEINTQKSEEKQQDLNHVKNHDLERNIPGSGKKSTKKKKKNIKEVRGNLKNKMPVPLGEINDQDVFG
ncbi:MAG: hypothetical protein K6G42_07550, partial [Lachnospiraceae bacterium]|nr:hypothetical protein [Lachnospiraceae bacterium]